MRFEVCKELKSFYYEYMIQEYNTWENCELKAVVVGTREFTYGDLYRMICYNVKKIKVYGKVLVLCNLNSLSFIVDLVSIMLSGNIPLIIPYYLCIDDREKIKLKCKALIYRNSDMMELLKVSEDDNQYGYEARRSFNDIAVIMFSSGTTAMGKMVPITYKSLYYRILYTGKYFKRMEASSELFLAPLSSALGLQHQLFPCLARKCTIILYEGIMNPRKIVDLINRYKIEYLSLVPSVLKCIYQYCLKKEEMLQNVEKIFICGEKLDTGFLRVVWEYFKGAKMYQAYGMSEILPVCIQEYNQKDDIVENCVGKVIKEVSVKIVEQDKDGIGEICVAGTNMINEYYGNDSSFEWLKTGDMGYIDEKQFLYVIGRKKNMVIINGNNIFIEEIEHIAETYCGIEDARAIGIQDDLRGEMILLQIKLKDYSKKKIRKEKLREYIHQNLRMSNVPIYIQIVNRIERTYNLKKRR